LQAYQFEHQADANAEWLGRERADLGHVTKAGTRPEHNGKAMGVSPEKAVKGAKQRSEIGHNSEKMLMDIR